MIELKLTVSNIDYESLAGLMAPMLIEQMNSENVPGWIKMMLIGSGMNSEGIKKIMSHFTESKLEAMAVKSINKNRDKTAEFLENMSKQQGVNICISDIEAKQV